MKNRKYALLSIILLLLGTEHSYGQQLPAKEITIYTAGKGHVIHEGVLDFADGHAMIKLPQSPLYGTYWLGSTQHLFTTFRYDTLKVESRPEQMTDYLKTLKDEPIEIHYATGNAGSEQVLRGTVHSVRKGGQLVTIQDTETGTIHTLFTDHADIFHISHEKPSDELSVLKDSVILAARLYPEEGANELPVSLHYLSDSYTWEPFFRFRLKGGDRAGVEYKARIHNNAGRLKDVDVSLAVGHPEVKFDDKKESFLPDDSRRRSRPQATRVYEMEAMAMDMETAPVTPERSRIGYIYRPGTMTLDAQSSADKVIMSEDVRYNEQLYSNVDHLAGNLRGGRDDPEEKRFPVYLAYTFQNNTDHPWPEAAVKVEDRDGSFIAQQQSRYTPTGDELNIRMAEMQDIIVNNQESVEERESGVRRLQNRMYGKARLSGVVSLSNHSDENRTVKIDKKVKGEILEVGQEGSSIQISPSGLNPENRITWEVEIAPGEEKEVTYLYEMFFRE